jgi:hypothetical protein
MKYIVIAVNVLFCILIIYNIFNKSNIIESLDNCPKDKKSKLYKHELKINNIFSQINTMDSELTNLKKKMQTNNEKSKNNAKLLKSSVGDIQQEKAAKLKELDSM